MVIIIYVLKYSAILCHVHFDVLRCWFITAVLELFAILSHNVDHVRIWDDNVDVPSGRGRLCKVCGLLRQGKFLHGFL